MSERLLCLAVSLDEAEGELTIIDIYMDGEVRPCIFS